MKRWGLLVACLYLLVLVSLTAPVSTLAFVDDYISSGDLGPGARREASRFVGSFEVFKVWWYWAVVGALFLAQLAFVPAVLLLYERRYRKIMEGRET